MTYGELFSFSMSILTLRYWQNFVLNVFEAQISAQITSDGSSNYWLVLFDKLNLFFTMIFTAELFVNMFAHWFKAFAASW